jgi:hypothetical protein
MEIKISEKVLNEVKDEVNLFLWNNNFPVETMKETNNLIEELKNAKINFN